MKIWMDFINNAGNIAALMEVMKIEFFKPFFGVFHHNQ